MTAAPVVVVAARSPFVTAVLVSAGWWAVDAGPTGEQAERWVGPDPDAAVVLTDGADAAARVADRFLARWGGIPVLFAGPAADDWDSLLERHQGSSFAALPLDREHLVAEVARLVAPDGGGSLPPRRTVEPTPRPVEASRWPAEPPLPRTVQPPRRGPAWRNPSPEPPTPTLEPAPRRPELDRSPDAPVREAPEGARRSDARRARGVSPRPAPREPAPLPEPTPVAEPSPVAEPPPVVSPEPAAPPRAGKPAPAAEPAPVVPPEPTPVPEPTPPPEPSPLPEPRPLPEPTATPHEAEPRRATDAATPTPHSHRAPFDPGRATPSHLPPRSVPDGRSAPGGQIPPAKPRPARAPRPAESAGTAGGPPGPRQRRKPRHKLDPNARRVEPAPRPGDPATVAEDLAERLLPLVDALATLTETADVVGLDACERVRCESSAVMVSEGNRWVVAGGHGLRPLERRYEVGPHHWLVDQIVSRERAAIVEDTDIARELMHGLPGSHRRHLMVVTVGPGLAAIVTAKDDDPPFSVDQLRELVDLAGEAAGPLRTALTIRALARGLEPHL